MSSPPKVEGRTIYYHVAEDNGDVDDENVQGYSFNCIDFRVYARAWISLPSYLIYEMPDALIDLNFVVTSNNNN